MSERYCLTWHIFGDCRIGLANGTSFVSGVGHTELAISDHMRWRLAVSAFLVWRSASSAADGMCSTSLLSGFRPVFLAVASHIDVDETCPFAVDPPGDPEFRRKQRAISILIAATLWADA